MVCPYLKQCDDGAFCKILLAKNGTRKHPLPEWVCRHEWKRYCPYFFENEMSDFAMAENDELQPDELAFRVRHINRLGGPRTVTGEFQ